MDFKKIARIFIIAFALLNIYLVLNIVERQDIRHTSSQPTEQDVVANIEASNIELPDLSGTEIEAEEVYSLQVNADDLLAKEMEDSDNFSGTLNDDGSYYVSFPSKPIVLEGNPTDGFTSEDYDEVEDVIDSEEIMFGEEYTFSHYDASSRRFVFYQVVDDIPIADGTSEISLFVNDKGEIYSYQQTYAGPVSRQGEALDLINGTRAIEILFLNNEIRQGSEVQKPILTYRRALYLEDLSMYSPVWLVNIDHSSERNTFRVDAVNGTIIKQSTSPPNQEQESTDNGENGEETEDDEADDEESNKEETINDTGA